MEGILPVYKSVGITSYDVVRTCKRKLREMGMKKVKIGHGGTLDPFAEGLLLVLIGRSNTKRMEELSALPKTYVARSVLGAKSDTLDCTGLITKIPHNFEIHELEQLKSDVVDDFIGSIEQKIPDFSAAKVNGVPRYILARKNHDLPEKTKMITVHNLEALIESRERASLVATVSSGTYIRQLSYDLFHKMGVESYLDKLIRTKIGEFDATDCIPYEELMTKDWQDVLR